MSGQIEASISECEAARLRIEELEPWTSLTMPVEELGSLDKADCMVGLIASGHTEAARGKLAEVGAAIETPGDVVRFDAARPDALAGVVARQLRGKGRCERATGKHLDS